ncbi:MAG: peptide deformylase [Limisphaerales bacterium]|jgi:peptide deformylase
MAVRKIIRMGHPNLRTLAQPVPNSLLGTADFNRLLDDMVDTLHDYGGIGLAAPQIDEPLRLAIVEIPGGPSRYGEIEALPLTAFINPTIQVLDDAPKGFWEGCLSVPGLRGFVERPQHIQIDYTNIEGEPATLTLQGFWATVFQHEFDHLDGVLYIDRIADSTKLVFEEEFVRYWQEQEPT